MMAPERLRRFSPLDSLTENGLRLAAEAVVVREARVGETLFRKGEQDHQVFFLLHGSIALRSDPASQPLLIRADTDASLVPLSRLKPRRYTATVEATARIAVIDEDFLDNLLTADHTAAYEVTEIEGEDPEWMFRMISSPAFSKVPTDNLVTLFLHLTSVKVHDGETVIRQGEAGDCYYIIRRGRAAVWRAFEGNAAVKVAELGVGDGFGEEALLSGEPRNATVVMLGEGQLMRLSMTDFCTLLEPSMVHQVDPSTAAAMIGNGAKFLDVRSESEFREYSLPSSINIPLCHLRQLSAQLERNRPYITVCQTGRRGTAAAFLLNQRGFTAMVLEGGLGAISKSGNS